jgi:hypothetical protein
VRQWYTACVFEISKIATTSLDADNFVGVQCDSFDDGSDFSELSCMGNFRSIPWDETEAGSCIGIQFQDGTDYFVLPMTDRRIVPLLPTGSKGSGTQWGFNGVKCDFSHFDESGYSLLVHDGAQDHIFKIDKNTHSISIIQASGTAIELNPDGAIIRTSAGSISISGNKLQVFGDFAVTGSISQVGGQPVILAPALIAYLTALEAAVNSKTPLGVVVPTPVAATLLAPGVGSTINTLINLRKHASHLNCLIPVLCKLKYHHHSI